MTHSGWKLEAPKDQTTERGLEHLSDRNFFARVVAVVCWFFPFIIVTNMIVGGVVGGIVGSDKSPDDAVAAVEVAVPEFFENYGLGIFLTQLVLYSVLTYEGILPGTSRQKSS